MDEFPELEDDDKMPISINPINTLDEEDNTEIISKYIDPSVGCIACNTPKFAIKINEAYLNGHSYKQIVDKFKEKVPEDLKSRLNVKNLGEHFSKHFKNEGAAIAVYNRKMGLSRLSDDEKKELVDIFETRVNNKVNDIELLDLTRKQQIQNLYELEELKKDRMAQGRSYNIENLIMKQEQLITNLQTFLLEKLKIIQKAQFQSKQMQLMDRDLGFLDHKTADFLGVDINKISNNPVLAKQASNIYLRVVISQLIRRLKDSMDVLTMDGQKKSEFLKEFQRQLQGIEADIDKEFKKKVNDIKEVNLGDELRDY